MVPNDDKISAFQVGLIVYLTPIGVGIFTLPATLANDVETNGWISLILGGLFCMLIIYFICDVGKKYSNLGLVETLKFLFGKVLGTILAFPVFLYYIVFTAMEIRIFGETTKMYLLFKTPLEYIMVPILILAMILTRNGIEPIARFFEATFFLIAFTLVLVILIYLPKSDYSNLLPILKVEPLKLIKSVSDSLFSLSGFEVLFLLFPFIRRPDKALKSSLIAISFITLLYVIIFIQCIARFGGDYTTTLLYPTLSLIKSSDIPGAFIEGIEGLLFSLWIVLIFTTIVMLIFAYSIVGSNLIKQKEIKHTAILFLPMIYVISLIPDSIAETFEFTDKLVIFLGYYTIIALPIIMFIASKIKGARG
ncbi:endospore germination permease [Caloramator sp. CAR-1]|uniref:GerAB/ArcD/ProY family transporter n=1 Tax=Caloramator sp. CAR-1 TaxID=3062777 RepID=UPI0026E1E011|nr:endospore germination permease [Caloramator sp. CAR-1]MDO6355786.1 endospore germination permease [Caloramator sp. CAR-1]